MNKVALSVLVVLTASSLQACKKDRSSSVKSETVFSPTFSKDLLTYTKDYTQAEFETAFNGLFTSHDLSEGYKCKVRKIQRFRDASKPELVPFQKLDDSELIGIVTYTGFAYSKINGPLRTIKRVPEALADDLNRPENKRMTETQRKDLQDQLDKAYRDIEPWRLIVLAAASGLNKLPRYDRPLIRGATLRDDALTGYCIKKCEAADESTCKTSPEPYFMSTTFNPGLGSFQGNTKFFITADGGHAVNEISDYPSEGEVLFVPGSDFIVKGVRFSGGKTCKDFMSGSLEAPASVGTSTSAAAGTSTETTVTPNAGLRLLDPPTANPDPTDCPDFVASAGTKPTTQLAQTSIGEAVLGTSDLAHGLSGIIFETAIGLTDLKLLDPSISVEIDLKQVHR